MAERWLRWGAPAALLAVTLVHPRPDADDAAASIGAVLPRWELVHVAQLVLFPLVALAAYGLLPEGAGAERRVARVGFAVFAVAATAFDAMVGLSTGVLVALAGDDPGRQALVQAYWTHRLSEPVVGLVYVGTAAGWIAGVAAVAVAMWRARAPLPAVALLAVSAVLAIDHAPPFGPVAMLGLLGASAVVAVRPVVRRPLPQ